MGQSYKPNLSDWKRRLILTWKISKYGVPLAAAFSAGVAMHDTLVDASNATQDAYNSATNTLTGIFNSEKEQKYILVVEGPDGSNTYKTDDDIRTVLVIPPTSSGVGPLTETYNTPKAMMVELRRLTEGDPISFSLLSRLTGSESGFDVDAVSNSGARGLLQFMPKTQLEYMYKHKDKLPEEVAFLAENIEKYTIKKDSKGRAIMGYRIKKGTTKSIAQATMNAIKDPVVSFILGREFVREGLKTVQNGLPRKLRLLAEAMEKSGKFTHERIDAIKAQIDRPLTYTDAKASHFLGPRGAIDFLAAYVDPKKHNHRALDYALKSTVSDNPHVFYKDGKKRKLPRSIAELYEYFNKMMGDDVLPKDLDRATAIKTTETLILSR